MTETKHTILESWPGLKDDLEKFLPDTDAWVISELKEAQADKNWQKVSCSNHCGVVLLRKSLDGIMRFCLAGKGQSRE